jgi:hypothetical protein
MNATKPARELDLATRWYRRLINLYPSTFRTRHSEEMLHFFEVEWTRAVAHGREARWRFGRSLAWDLLRTLPKELFLAAPIMWLLSAVGVALSLTLAFFDPACGSCELVFLAFVVLLRLTSRFFGLVLIVLLGAPFGLGVARLIESVHAHNSGSGTGIGAIAVIYSAACGFNLSVVLFPAGAKLRDFFRAKRCACMLVFCATAVGLVLGRIPFGTIMGALASVWTICVFVRALYLRVWRGTRFPALEGPLFTRRPLNW